MGPLTRPAPACQPASPPFRLVPAPTPAPLASSQRTAEQSGDWLLGPLETGPALRTSGKAAPRPGGCRQAPSLGHSTPPLPARRHGTAGTTGGLLRRKLRNRTLPRPTPGLPRALGRHRLGQFHAIGLTTHESPRQARQQGVSSRLLFGAFLEAVQTPQRLQRQPATRVRRWLRLPGQQEGRRPRFVRSPGSAICPFSACSAGRMI